MYKIFVVLIVLICLACNGCTCTYEDRAFKATIVSITIDPTPTRYSTMDTAQKETYEVKMLSDIPNRDTLYLDEMIERSITKDFLDQHRLREGKTLDGAAHLITSGTCHPGKFSFSDSTLSPY